MRARGGAMHVVAVAILLGACAGSDGAVKATRARETDARSTQPGGTATVTDGEVNVEALQSQIDAMLAMAPAEQEAMLATLDGQVERELWTLSGLEAELGGPAAADAVFAEHSQAIAATARASADAPILRSGVRRSASPSTPNLGEGLFGGLIVVNLATGLVSSTNDLKDGESGSRSTDDKSTTATISLDKVLTTLDVTHESGGVTTKLQTELEINPCPDASGHLEASASIAVSATKTGGSTGQNGTLDLKVTAEVDDDAKLASSDADYRMQWADFSGGKGSFVDVSGSYGDTKVSDFKLNRSGGAANPTLLSSAASMATLFGMMMKMKILEEAEKGWQSGRCVALKPTAAPGPKGLEPGATSTIVAAPRSRIDGTPVGGTVTATLSAGGATVDPAGSKVPADATFTYTAPAEADQTGSVALEARSRRGVAKASIDFDTKRGSYTASGGTEVVFSGTIADLSVPFTLHGVGQGFEVDFAYVPSSDRAGTVTYKGAGSGITMEGSGSYSITGEDPDPLTLTQTAYGCVDVGGCRNTTDVITLTRTSG